MKNRSLYGKILTGKRVREFPVQGFFIDLVVEIKTMTFVFTKTFEKTVDNF